MKKKCCICKKEAFSDGVGITIYSVSESGKIQDMNATKNTSMQVLVPLCAYHLVLVNEDVVCFTTGNKMLMRGKVEHYENKNKKELKQVIKNSLKQFKLTRKKVENQKKMSELKIAIMIDNARNFQEGMTNKKS